jgi:hypothetical protein
MSVEVKGGTRHPHVIYDPREDRRDKDKIGIKDPEEMCVCEHRRRFHAFKIGCDMAGCRCRGFIYIPSEKAYAAKS